MDEGNFIPDDDDMDEIPEMENDHDTSFDPAVFGKVPKLDKDLVKSIGTMGREEARYLVDLYYAIQANRVVTGNQISAMEKSREPHAMFQFMFDEQQNLENRIKKVMEHWTEHSEVAKILKEQVYGIGPVLSAGIVANFDIRKAATPGAFWRFAGLDPTQHWVKKENVEKWIEENKKDCSPQDMVYKAAAFFGRNAESLMRFASTDKDGNVRKKMTYANVVTAISRRPYNASLKTLSWKISGSFVKFSSRSECFYGHLYRQQKQYLVDKDAKGEFKELAANVLLKKKFTNKEIEAIYKGGNLPKGHIDGMAKRWTVKMFIANVHELWRVLEGLPVAPPYPIAHLGHAHYICQPELRAIMDEKLKGG